MPTRNDGSSLLPFFSTSGNGGTSSRSQFFIPRSYLSPRVFLSCILATFTISWLMLYSYSHVALGLSSSARDSEDWALLEQRMGGSTSKTMRWMNDTLTSTFSCDSTTSTTQSIQGSGFNRETICTVQNLCVDAERGAWIHPVKGSEELPWINIVAADPGSDAYYRPLVLDQFPASSFRFVDDTIFLYGRDPTNGPSWTMNNLLPLHSIMISYKGLGSSWFMRVSGQENKHNERRQKYRQLDDQDMHLDTYLLAPRGREIVLSSQKGKPLASHQISAPSKQYPTCFAKAVIGMQSRCTRPFCENLIGGSVLTESLRTKALDVLSPSMQQFQTTDPDIVHAPVGENVAVVSQDNYTIAKGESAPRSKIQVALLGRYGNTSIPNANMLELSLLEKGFSAKTIHFDHPSEISLAQAAQLFKSESILVAPQGDGLGYSTWMAPGTVVISILPRYTRSSNIYTDRMMAFGKRFFAWDCQDETCVQQDRDLAHECIEAIQNSFGDQSITAQDFEEFVTMKHDFRLRSEAWKAISDCYTRDVSRRINVDELTILIEDLAKDFSFVAPDAERKYRAEETKLTRRAVPEDTPEDVEEGEDEEDPDAATDPEENDEEAATDPEEDDKEAATDPEENDEEAEQDDKDTTSEDNGEPDEEDINVHEYDEVKAPPEEQDEDRPVPKHPVKPPAPPAHPALPAPPAQSGLPAPPPPPPPPAKPAPPPPAQPAPPAPEVNMPKTPYTPEVDLQHRVVRPIYGFVDFCKRGRCCGSAKISVREYIGTIGTKGLTPCAASMSTMVFGDKGVWRLTDQLGSTKETQSLVWQVDLARDLKKIAKL